MDMTNDLSKRARRGAAAMCHTIKLTIETSLPTWIQSWKDPQQITDDKHCHQQWKWLTYIYNANTVGRKQCTLCNCKQVATSTAWSNLPSTKTMNTSMLWPMTRIYSRFSGCDSQLFGKGKTTSVSTMITWWGIGDVGLGASGDDGTDTSMVTTTRQKSITVPLNNMACTSSHFQGTGYGMSSSSVRILFILVALFCESVFDDICSSVVHPLPHSPFSLISPLTLSNHLILGLSRSLPYISIVILPTQCSSLHTICPYQFRILSWISIAISPTFGASIPYLSFLKLSCRPL